MPSIPAEQQSQDNLDFCGLSFGSKAQEKVRNSWLYGGAVVGLYAGELQGPTAVFGRDMS